MDHFYQLSPAKQAEKLQLLASVALANWNIQPSNITLIKYRENAVFKVETGSDKFALRIHRPGYHSNLALQSELAWIAALEEAGIPVPAVIATCEHKLCISVQVEGVPEARDVDLFAWVEGETLGSVESGVAQDTQELCATYAYIGELAAKLHNQSSTWDLPKNFQRHAWDCDALVGEQPFWGPFWQLPELTKQQRSLLLSARAQVQKNLCTLEKTARNYSMIHADFVPENLMKEGDNIRLIDFDDAGFGWHMFELATALYFITQDTHYVAVKEALFAGYRKHRPLPETDITLLDTFLAARGFSYLGWIMDRGETETAQQMSQSLIDLACYHAKRLLEKKQDQA